MDPRQFHLQQPHGQYTMQQYPPIHHQLLQATNVYQQQQQQQPQFFHDEEQSHHSGSQHPGDYRPSPRHSRGSTHRRRGRTSHWKESRDVREQPEFKEDRNQGSIIGRCFERFADEMSLSELHRLYPDLFVAYQFSFSVNRFIKDSLPIPLSEDQFDVVPSLVMSEHMSTPRTSLEVNNSSNSLEPPVQYQPTFFQSQGKRQIYRVSLLLFSCSDDMPDSSLMDSVNILSANSMGKLKTPMLPNIWIQDSDHEVPTEEDFNNAGQQLLQSLCPSLSLTNVPLVRLCDIVYHRPFHCNTWHKSGWHSVPTVKESYSETLIVFACPTSILSPFLPPSVSAFTVQNSGFSDGLHGSVSFEVNTLTKSLGFSLSNMNQSYFELNLACIHLKDVLIRDAAMVVGRCLSKACKRRLMDTDESLKGVLEACLKFFDASKCGFLKPDQLAFVLTAFGCPKYIAEQLTMSVDVNKLNKIDVNTFFP
ncbi:hypothetical protein GEMRC1_007203 [Eukaryota sp. GEM-RC1]